MMDKEELINGYFEGSLSQNQLEELERLLSSDTEFASEFEFQKELQISLKKEERSELKNLFNSLSEDKAIKETKVIRLRPWLAAASIALLVGLGSWFLFFNSQNLNTDELYATNFAPYDNVVHPIERGNQLEDLKTRAFTAYENQEYGKALELFEELHIKQNDSYIDFYSAIVLMELDQHEEAILLLEGYMKKEGELKERATWYLALAYLKVKNITNCKVQLNVLIEKNGFKSDSAQTLLKQLN